MGDYILNQMPPQMQASRAARLANVEVATLGHYLHAGFADTGLRPITSGHRIAGAAVTVQIAGPCSTLLYYAMDRVRPGDVLVIDRAGDTRHACWGGFMAAVARVRGHREKARTRRKQMPSQVRNPVSPQPPRLPAEQTAVLETTRH